MKKSFLTLVAVFLLGFTLSAQIDVSINPIGIFFSSYDISAEKGINDNFGVELTAGLNTRKYDEFKSTGFGTRLMAKYYLSPNKGLDKFNIGAYLRYGSNKFDDGADDVSNVRVAAGFYLGYKIVSSSNVFFELGFGVGRAFVSKYSVNGEELIDTSDYPILNIDATGKFAVGYRF